MHIQFARQSAPLSGSPDAMWTLTSAIQAGTTFPFSCPTSHGKELNAKQAEFVVKKFISHRHRHGPMLMMRMGIPVG